MMDIAANNSHASLVMRLLWCPRGCTGDDAIDEGSVPEVMPPS
jgi:hypothetical protein